MRMHIRPLVIHRKIEGLICLSVVGGLTLAFINPQDNDVNDVNDVYDVYAMPPKSPKQMADRIPTFSWESLW